MTATAEAEEVEETTPKEQEEFLPPPDPPVVESPPTDPPEPLEVEDDSDKFADPEVDAVRELNIVIEGTPGDGPRPEQEPQPREE